jgi:hypothetical protein
MPIHNITNEFHYFNAVYFKQNHSKKINVSLATVGGLTHCQNV